MSPPATDLGYLLHKHPERVQSFPTTQGHATVFYPVATDDRCRVVVHVDGAGARAVGEPDRYVNTVAHAASSRLIVALGKVFGDAIAGRCAMRPDLTEKVWPLRIEIVSVPVRGPDPVEVFAPLGWSVTSTPQRLHPASWGDSVFRNVVLEGSATVREALRHVCVLVPVIADDKHYFVDEPEIDKLDRLGKGWLDGHPGREEIVRGYLKHVAPLTRRALVESGADDAPVTSRTHGTSLAGRRVRRVADLIRQTGAHSVLDIGCGEGKLLAELVSDRFAGRLSGVDVSMQALERAQRRLERWRGVELWQSSLMYTDPRCRGHDAVVLMEVVEHIEPDRLPTAVYSVFESMAPGTVIVTTPNREHNPVFGLAADEFRHPDHRFEFTRAEFGAWCDDVCATYGYTASILEIGDRADGLGAPTQTAVFTRVDGEVGR
ncbi:3' terminal RNA ribose 2'-O-methyltransferase Hen1 [Gordonia sp. DT30]|uniref:3' terminal RNA ribose 2'-O-methyltransferase Hen1 n=1 Tax=unclassified Gordonia (in: high G+C Gram-positive bacteria) TaxID=2657482 RepID=UPI003CF1CE0A